MPRLSFERSLLLFLFLIVSFPHQAHALTGKVISIADGDTITILDSSNQQHKIRLYGIDTPEKKQAFGKAAKKHTSRLTYKKQATVILLFRHWCGRFDNFQNQKDNCKKKAGRSYL
ncbi:MAG: endonuclease YncB(thermonuclease family) [Desulforhopalus sp.]|jgi:endonuclease YncB( thermonuclease family)